MHLTYNISVGLRLSGGEFHPSIGTIGTNGISFIPLVFYWWNASHYGDLNISVGFRLSWGAFYLSIGTIGTIGTNGITFISLVFHWWNASHYGDLNISVGFRLSRGAFYSSIGTIGTNGITFIPLVFHWWNASHQRDLKNFRRLQVEWGCILLVHWYDWYQWNNIYSIGEMRLVTGNNIILLASGWVGVHSTRPLVRLVPME